MGYFSNGSEGCDYEAEYCDHCVHQNGPDGKTGCAVWLAHMLHNYKECRNPNSILNLLIPRTKLGNEKCLMFHPDKGEKKAMDLEKRAAEERAKYELIMRNR